MRILNRVDEEKTVNQETKSRDLISYGINLFLEIANVADNLDSLNSVLDTIEERADQIRAQLLELLTSNREIRQSLREENEKNQGLCQQSSEQKHDGESDDAESSPAPHQE